MSTRQLIVLCALGSLLVACKVKDPLYCDKNTPCTDPARPFCDVDGTYPASDGIGNTCISDPTGPDAGPGDENTPDAGAACQASTSVCADDETTVCGADGHVAEVKHCALGCNDTGERCVDVDPSNDLGGYLDMTDTAPDVALSAGAVIDTDAGTITDGDGTVIDVPDFQVTAPAGGVAIRVFAVKSLSIADATVTGARALAIVSDGDITIAGHVRVLAGAMTSGACLGRGSSCDQPSGGSLAGACGGGGGGGFGGIGGAGGKATAGSYSGVGGAGGSTSGNERLVPLRGGCAGGNLNNSDPGGAGGGAIQLVSRTLVTLDQDAPSAFVDAGGESSQMGGGSGGAILIEAPHVVVPSGTGLVANGASGGCIDMEGSPGTLSGTSATGGLCSNGANFADGGRGSGLTLPNGGNGDDISKPALESLYVGGGGGGGAGRIRVNVPTALDFGGGGIKSPDASRGVLQTR